jgi:hypothetical protein
MVNLESVGFEEKPLYDDEMLDVYISSCDENEEIFFQYIK